MLLDIAIIVATILGILFPAYLIDAIRCEEEKAAESKQKVCLIFGALVLITLMIFRS